MVGVKPLLQASVKILWSSPELFWSKTVYFRSVIDDFETEWWFST